MSEAVVIGGGPGAARAAVALAKAGRSVTLLQVGAFADGVAHPEVPIGRGVTTSPPALGEALYGPFRAVDGLGRAVLHKGRVHGLPLARPRLAAFLPPAQVLPAAVAWVRTRGATELKKFIGGGAELRTYQDWVAQRFGAPVYEQLFAAYARKRFGEPGDLSCNVARLAHGLPEGDARWAPAGGPELSLAGVKVHTRVRVSSLATGRVETDQGTFEGDVFLDVPPAVAVTWLDEADATTLVAEASRLGARDAVQVLLRGGDELPFETHALDADVPFYRVVRPGLLPGCERLAGHVCVHFACDADDASSDGEWIARSVDGLGRAGVKVSPSDGARVQRVAWQHPIWVGPHLARMRRWMIGLEELGLTPVGRAGLHAPLSLAAELAWLEGVIAEDRPSLRELARQLVEPPVLDPEERARLTRFVER